VRREAIDLDAVDLVAREGARERVDRNVPRLDVACSLVNLAIECGRIAVFDAKYHYNFWRPITAIRNGDIDDNPATDREATWQPIDNTPMHPEYQIV